MKAGGKRDIGVREAIRRRVLVGLDTVTRHVGELIDAAEQGYMVVGSGIDVSRDFEAGSVGTRDDERHKDGIKASAEGWVRVAFRVIVFGLMKKDFDQVRSSGEDLRP